MSCIGAMLDVGKEKMEFLFEDEGGGGEIWMCDGHGGVYTRQPSILLSLPQINTGVLNSELRSLIALVKRCQIFFSISLKSA